MTDETETQPQGDTEASVATEAPAAEAQPAAEPAPVDVESIVSQRLAEWEEKRIKPLQQLVSERDRTINELKTASMSEEEREQLQIEEQERERQSFETERWLFTKAKENADAAEVFEKIVNSDDPDEQFAVIADLVARLNATPAPAAQPEPSVPDIDPNNPAPAPSAYQTLPDGTPINRTLAEEFLKKLGSWPTRG